MNKLKNKINYFTTPIKEEHDISKVVQMLKQSDKYEFSSPDKVKASVVDNFLFSGRFNSVLGLDGFNNFKDGLKDVIKKVNADDFSSNYVNIDKIFEALLSSGIYYIDEKQLDELNQVDQSENWLTAYRYISKNFPEITYKDFREIVQRFKDADGVSIYVEPSDTEFLQKLSNNSRLFRLSVDTKDALLHLSMKELRALCELVGATSSRSIEETVERLIAHETFDPKTHMPKELASRKTLVIIDQELATGNEIIKLDQYLRIMAKAVRDDFVSFVNKSRFGSIAA